MDLLESKPVKLSSRAKSQVDGKNIERKRLEDRIRALTREIIGIVDNDLKHADEDDVTMTARLRRYRVRQGLPQVRFHATGSRNIGRENKVLKAFRYIYGRCRNSGCPGYAGTVIPVADIAAHINASARQTYRILDRLENQTPHGAFAVYRDGLESPPLRQPNPGVILRLGEPGGGSRFCITLPESNEYHKEVLSTLHRVRSSYVDVDEAALPTFLIAA